MGNEINDIRARYRRQALAHGDLSGGSLFRPHCYLLQPDCYMAHQEKERAFLRILSRFDCAEIQSMKVLEIGCGFGANILQLLRWGFEPRNIVGVDLLSDRCAYARTVLPAAVEVIDGDALELVYPDESFDIVFASTVFTSILDSGFQEKLARKTWSLVRPGGAILWYDFINNNPANSDVKGVPRRRVRELFPEARGALLSISLAPPIARLVCRIHPILYTLLNFFPFLRTHIVGWLEKQKSETIPS
jgi:SAM-dependent methyltransferase